MIITQPGLRPLVVMSRKASHTIINVGIFTSILMCKNLLALEENSLPGEGVVVSGSASLLYNDLRLDIQQTTDRAVIDWRSFDIGNQAHVNFDQPDVNSIAVNRINESTNPTQINGQLSANGQVWVLNPNGVIFGANSQIDVSGLLASTARIDVSRFMEGDMKLDFSSGGNGTISNFGEITIQEEGLAAFVAPSVKNNGIIHARLGKVSLASGDTFTLDLAGDRLVEIGLANEGALVQQFGQVVAEGGIVEISAGAAGALVNSIVNLSGYTSASSAQVVGGEIVLSGSDIHISGELDVSGMAGGGAIHIQSETITTTETASLKADSFGTGNGGIINAYADIKGQYDGEFSSQGGANGGNGGFIETSGKTVNIANNLSVNTLAQYGETGDWSIDPEELTVIETGGNGTSTIGADTIVTNLESTNVTLLAEEIINLDADINSSAQVSSTTLAFNDENSDNNLTLNLNAEIALGSNQTLSGQGTTVNVNTGADVQNGVDVSAAGATINVAAGNYALSSPLDIDKAITLNGIQAGVDARDRSEVESVLTGSISITDNADNTVIDGLTIAEGSSAAGENAGIVIKHDASNITIQNTIFTRSGDVDGDTYRGILTYSNGNQTDLLIQNNHFSGWATGIYLNPGATGAQIMNNNFAGNYVGVSVDGPDAAVITGNQFSNNLFEGLGLGPGAGSPSVTVADNEFASNTTHIGVYDNIQVDATSNAFDGTLATAMSTAQLVALEDEINHGLDDGFAGLVITREGNVYVTQDSGSIQRAHNAIGAGSSASDRNIINIAPGDYTEGTANVSQAGVSGGGLNFGLHLFNDNILLQGLDSEGNIISDPVSTLATVTAGYQAGFGAQHFVYGDGIEVTGLTFKPVSGGTNKTFEVIGNNFTLRNSVIDNRGNATVGALYMSEFGDVEGNIKDVETFTIDNNIFYGGEGLLYNEVLYPAKLVTLTNGAGNDTDSANRIFTNNTLVGTGAAEEAGLQFVGIYPDIAWRNYGVGAAVIEGNTFLDLDLPISSRGVSHPELNLTNLLVDNIFDGGAALALAGGSPDQAQSIELYCVDSECVSFSAITRQINDSLDIAQDGDTILVKAGTYTEATSYGSSTLGMVIDKSVTIQGIDGDGEAITSRDDIVATIISGGESNWGTNFFVTGSDVTVGGLRFEAVSADTDSETSPTTINKAFEITADGFTLDHSVVAAADGFDFDGKTSTAIYFGDDGADDLNNFLINDSLLEGGITITNGAGDGVEPVDFTITDNVFTGNHFLRIRGEVDGVGWLNASAHAPTTVTGNDVSGVSDYILEIWGNDAETQVDMSFLDALIADNTLGEYVYAMNAEDNLRFSDYTEYGGTAPAFFMDKSIQDIVNITEDGDTVLVGAGTYGDFGTSYSGAVDLTIEAMGDVTIDGSGSTRAVDLRADGTILRGFHIIGSGTQVGVSISGQDVTVDGNVIENVLTGIQTTTQYVDTNATITDNSISDAGHGISLQSNNNVVTGNTINVTTEGFGIGSEGNTITGNILSVDDGVHLKTYTTDDYAPLPLVAFSSDDLLAFVADNTFDGATYISDGINLTVGTIFGAIQDAIDSALEGNTVHVLDGTYSLSSTLNIGESITLSGQSRDGTILDGRNIGNNYGISVSADDVSLSDFTLYGSASNTASAYGIKVSPGGNEDARLTNFSIDNVLSRGAGRAELDLNGVNSATINNFIADGAPLGIDDGTTNGAGIQLTDTANVIITNTTTRNNAWGGVALYQANRSYNQQTANISIDALSNSFNEVNGLYSQDESALHDFGALNLTGFSHIVRNDDFREGGNEYTFFQVGQQNAIDYAMLLNSAESSYIRGWNGSAANNIFTVGSSTVGVGTEGQLMNIGTALDAAAEGSSINILQGNYGENLAVTKTVNLSFDQAIVDGLTINSTNSTLRGTLSSSQNGFVFNTPLILSGNTSLTTTGNALIQAGSIDAMAAGQANLAINANSSVVLGSIGAIGGATGGAAEAGATTRLGEVSVTGNGIVLEGSNYNADNLTFNGDVTITQDMTEFNSAVSAVQAGDITFNGNLLGIVTGSQNVIFGAGSGSGNESANGNILLQNAGTELVKLGDIDVSGNNFSAATVWMAGDFTSLLTGDQIFTDNTLNADGNVTSVIGGSAVGPIVTSAAASIAAVNSISGSISGANVTLAGSSVEASVVAVETATVTATSTGAGGATGGTVSGNISARNVAVSGANVTSNVTATETANVTATSTGATGGTVSGNISARNVAVAGANVTSNVTATETASVIATATGTNGGTTGGTISGNISARNVAVTGENVTSNVTAIEAANITANNTYTGTVNAAQTSITAEIVNAEVNGGSATINASGGRVTGNPSTLDLGGEGVLEVNGQRTVGSTDADLNQLFMEDFTISADALYQNLVDGVSGLQLANRSEQTSRVMLVGSVNRLGELLAEGYETIVINLDQDEDEEREL